MKKTRNELRNIKRRAQRRHVQKRILERLGVTLCDDELDALKLKIERGRAHMLARPSLRASIWRTEINNQRVVIVYDHETEELATVMTTGMWQEMDLCNSPAVKEHSVLQSSIKDTPAGKALQELKERLKLINMLKWAITLGLHGGQSPLFLAVPPLSQRC
jgi:hypothetical protein